MLTLLLGGFENDCEDEDEYEGKAYLPFAFAARSSESVGPPSPGSLPGYGVAGPACSLGND